MRIPKTAAMQMVRVEWIDSASCHGWEDASNLANELSGQRYGALALCVTVGFLYRVGPKDIALAPTQQPHKDASGPWRVCDVFSIPRTAITGFRSLS